MPEEQIQKQFQVLGLQRKGESWKKNQLQRETLRALEEKKREPVLQKGASRKILMGILLHLKSVQKITREK
jgi:hypothetical protein